MSNLKKRYLEKIVPELEKEYGNKMAVPKVVKVIVNVGIGKIRDNEKQVTAIKNNLAAITGQYPATKKAKKAISGFKVREGDNVGLMVTLRGEKMYDFLDKLANITLQRIRDFRGINNDSFDKNGNISIGIRESIYFPEISHESENIHSLEITIVTKADNNSDSQKMLEKLGFPFKDKVFLKEKIESEK